MLSPRQQKMWFLTSWHLGPWCIVIGILKDFFHFNFYVKVKQLTEINTCYSQYNTVKSVTRNGASRYIVITTKTLHNYNNTHQEETPLLTRVTKEQDTQTHTVRSNVIHLEF